MARRDSVFETHGTLVLAALAASDLLAGSGGFRARDVRFYVDLFANWLEFGKQKVGFSVQIVQLQRYLAAAVKRREVTLLKVLAKPAYRFTDTGFLKLIETLVGFERLLKADELVFLTYLLQEYHELLSLRLIPEGRFHNKTRKQEILNLIDPDRAVSRQIELVHSIRRDLAVRIEESDEITHFVAAELGKGVPCAKVIAAMDKRFTYQLAGQKSFKELFAAVPESMLEDELSKGFSRRNQRLFAKLLKYYDGVERTLGALQSQRADFNPS